MNIKKILCPVDFSSFTDKASEFASIFAKATGAEIVYLHVAPQDASNGDYGYAMERTRERALSRLVVVEPTIGGINFRHDVKVCSLIADTIVKYAQEQNIDLIVIPTHGRTGLRRLVLGSVTEAVLRKASCAVATVRPNSDFFDQTLNSELVAESVPVQKESEGVV